MGGRCAGRNPPSVLGGIQLYGLPAPPAGGTRRLFALSPRGSAVSTQPPGVLAPDRGSQHLPGEVPFLSGADALAPRLAASRPCSVDGVSSDPYGPGGRSPAHRPRDKEETGSISLPEGSSLIAVAWGPHLFSRSSARSATSSVRTR